MICRRCDINMKLVGGMQNGYFWMCKDGCTYIMPETKYDNGKNKTTEKSYQVD
jgi:predicted NUDIX family NTP pyrophosphohydrolase|tara:strand:- start:40 stop:198 length:159 start_codon:yes stop_codon:yes gene_type:complete